MLIFLFIFFLRYCVTAQPYLSVFFSFLVDHSVKILLRQIRHTTWKRNVRVRLISNPYQHLLTTSNQKAQHHFPLHRRWKLLKKSRAYSFSWINLDNFHVCRCGCGASCYECLVYQCTDRSLQTFSIPLLLPLFFFHTLPSLDNDWKE